jgi:hypothetical protein
MEERAVLQEEERAAVQAVIRDLNRFSDTFHARIGQDVRPLAGEEQPDPGDS